MMRPCLHHEDLRRRRGSVDRRCAITSAVRPSRATDERLLHRDLGLRVEVGGRLVEDHDPGSGQEEPGDGEPLPLPARQPVPALADHGVEPVGQGGHQVGEARRVERRPELVVGGVGRGVAQVGPHVSWNRWPSWVTTPTAARMSSKASSRTSTPPSRTAPASTSYSRGTRTGEGRLPGTRRSDQRDRLARLDHERRRRAPPPRPTRSSSTATSSSEASDTLSAAG